MTNERGIYNGEMIASSISGGGKTEDICKKMKLDHSLTPHTHTKKLKMD